MRIDRRTVRAVVAGLAVALVVLAAVRVAVHDPRSQPLSGDQANFVYNALSLRGGDLSYDQVDEARWDQLGWEENPRGLFFQAHDEGWAFAKPLGYSVVLAPALKVAGARGISIVGALFVLAYAISWYAIGRLRWDRATAAVVSAAATVASHAWMFAFPAHADLFVAVLVATSTYACLRAALRREPAWLVVAGVVTALLVTEKVPAVIALLPLLVTAGGRAGRRAGAAALVAFVAVVAITVIPYRHYSDGVSWSAYGGERYYTVGNVPWGSAPPSGMRAMGTDEVISAHYAVERALHPSWEMADAAVSYVIGQRTGALTFLPIVPFLLVATAVRWRRRPAAATDAADATDAPDDGLDPPADRPIALAAAAGLALYAAFYVVLFTSNHYGGLQSIGSRYFLQISPLAAAVPVAAGLAAAAAWRCAGAAAVWAILVLGPNLVHADTAFTDPSRTSWAQRLLPLDGSQDGYWVQEDPEVEPSEDEP